MHQPVLLAAVSLCLVSGAAAAATNAPADVALFTALLKERAAGSRGDRAQWRRHVSEECLWVGPRLSVGTTAEVDAMQLDTGTTSEVQDLVVHTYGNAAVLTYLLIEHIPQGDQVKTARLRKLDTYARVKGEWRLVSNAEIVGRPERKVAKVDPRLYDRYAGTYRVLLNGKPVAVRFWREGDRFLVQAEGQTASELLPESETVFFGADDREEGSSSDIFVLDAEGNVVEEINRMGDIEFHATRTGP